MPWIKLDIDWPFDPKVRTMSEVMRYRHAALLCLRGRNDLTQLTEPEIAAGLGISLRQLKETYVLFVEKGFIEPDWSMPKWEARQIPADPTAAERMRRYRANHPRHVTRNGPATAPPGAREPSKHSESKPGARARNVTPNGPDPIAPPVPPELARLAADLGGPGWADWPERMVRDGYPVEWLGPALRRLADSGHIREPYARGILESYRESGGPDRRPGDPPPPRPPPEPPSEPPDIPDGPEGDRVRAMYRKEPKP